MKISEKQLLMLVDIAKDSLRILGPLGGYEPQTRLQMINDIMNQQSNSLVEVDPSIPDKNVESPEYDYTTEGFDPTKLPMMAKKKKK